MRKRHYAQRDLSREPISRCLSLPTMSSTFGVGYCAALWRNVEQPLLENILRPLGGPEQTSLDFACGTGRIAKVAASFFGSVVDVTCRSHALGSFSA